MLLEQIVLVVFVTVLRLLGGKWVNGCFLNVILILVTASLVKSTTTATEKKTVMVLATKLGVGVKKGLLDVSIP